MSSPRSEFGFAQVLELAEKVILPSQVSRATSAHAKHVDGHARVGVDLGTAYLVLVVLDQDGQPTAGEY